MAFGKKFVLCFLVLGALGLSAAVVEKTKEDAHNRRFVFTAKNRTETKHVMDRKRPTQSKLNVTTSTSSVLSHSHANGQIKDPIRTNNHSKWSHRPHHHGSLQIGPGFNIQVSGGLDWGFGEDDRWWKGPNVCFRNEATEETMKDLSSADYPWRIMHHRLIVSHACDDTGTAYKCTTIRGVNGKVTTSIKIYECCPGHERREDEPGCSKEIEVTDLMSTLERLNATEMMESLKMSGLARLISHNNYTIFAPVNDAYKKYRVEEADSNVVKITPELVNLAQTIDDTIVGHVVKGFVRTADVEDEQLLPTELQAANIRINKYNVRGKKLMTANCVPMVVKDIPATNGIVHLVQDMLPTATQSLDQLVSGNPELTQLSRVMKSLQLNNQGQYTLFAPTNSAFEKMKPGLKEKVLHGHRCGIEVLKQHLLPNVICSSVTQTRAITKNVLDRHLTLSRQSNKLLVGDAQVTQPDVMGINGVMHVIDQVLIPEDAGDILDAADRTGTSHFLQLIESAGLLDQVHSMNNFTMFLPTNDAIKDLPADVLDSLRKDTNQLERIVNYHIIPRRIKYRGLLNDMELPTLDGKNEILVKSYFSFPFSRYSVKTVQCAQIVQSDVNSCGDIVHTVSKVLIPPSGSVLQMLEKNPSFTKLMTLIKEHELKDLFEQEQAFTFFAPTNKAFESLPLDALNKLKNDTTVASKILKSHMISDILCCAGVLKNTFPFSSREVNMAGWIVSLENSGKISFGHVPVSSCDQTATNGVVHSIDQFVPSALSRYELIRATNPWQRLFARWKFDDLFDYFDEDDD